MTAFSKADVQNVRIGIDLNVCLWPKADVHTEISRTRKENQMIFHISYELSSENREAAQNRFKETGGLPPEGVEMLGR